MTHFERVGERGSKGGNDGRKKADLGGICNCNKTVSDFDTSALERDARASRSCRSSREEEQKAEMKNQIHFERKFFAKSKRSTRGEKAKNDVGKEKESQRKD